MTGGCQCGALRYELRGPLPKAIVCHCRECQKQSASAFGMTLVVAKHDFRLLSGTPKVWRRPADSGREVACFFCSDCGSRLYHSSSLGPDYLHLKAGTLEGTSRLAPIVQARTGSAQPWLRLDEALPSFPGQPSDIAALLRC